MVKKNSDGFYRCAQLALVGVLVAAAAFGACTDSNHSANQSDCVASYRWDPDNPPAGRNAPYVSSFGDHYVLKLNKYMEGFADLGQGKDDCLKLTGPMTLTVSFQLAKQWPMKAGLVSKWGFMDAEASYELGLTSDRRLYFTISEDGRYDGKVTEVVSQSVIEIDKPVVVTAVFAPSQKMALYINGALDKELVGDVPQGCFDSSSRVCLGRRFEGLLGGVWFHDRNLGEPEIQAVSKEASETIPPDAPYAKWERLKRDVPRSPADYLGTTEGMKLYKEIDISKFAGCYVCPGDLNNDGKVDFLLYKNGGSYTVPGRLIAIDFDGKVLWEFGDPNLTTHAKSGSAPIGEPGTTPALRGIATVCDIDQDGRSDVIAEMWEENKPMLYVFDGATGSVKHRRESPLDMSIRQPAYKIVRQPSRSHPVVRIAWLDGRDKSPSIIIKYGASSGIPCHAFALDSSLNVRWHIAGTLNSMGHVPTVADVDNDGRDEIVLGHMLADDNGKVLWDKGQEFGWHADTTAVAELSPQQGKEVLISVCGTGPVHCLSQSGKILWSKSREEVEHGQAVWAGNFIDDNLGLEAIVCASGHVGSFLTLDGSTGKTLAHFEHRKLFPSYPDFPAVVNWLSRDVQSLWIPQDRTLVDGRGKMIAELGTMDEYVAKKLHCGTSWRPVGAQVFALDICGDERDELIMYEPYEGERIFIFANPQGGTEGKPYIEQANAYNIRSYF